MISLFHGSRVVVSRPKLLSTDHKLDFGQGFYTTTIQTQAEDWARKVGEDTPSVSVYTYDDLTGMQTLKFLDFNSVCIEWLQFIFDCKFLGRPHGYDLVTGPFIRGKALAILRNLAEDKELSRVNKILSCAQASETEQQTIQYAFNTTKSLRLLKFDREASYTLSPSKNFSVYQNEYDKETIDIIDMIITDLVIDVMYALSDKYTISNKSALDWIYKSKTYSVISDLNCDEYWGDPYETQFYWFEYEFINGKSLI